MDTGEHHSSNHELDFEDSASTDFAPGIAGYEIAYGSSNKSIIKKKAKQQNRIKQKLDLINEKKRFERDTNPLSDYWEM